MADADDLDDLPEEFVDAVNELIAHGVISRAQDGSLGITELGVAALDGRVDLLPIRIGHHG